MTILIVEDEEGIANFLKQGLEEEDFKITIAKDGEQGLKLALTQHFDLLLLDWMLPLKSGVEICTTFRKKDTQTPILFLTAKDTVEETIKGLKAGANDYIKKPFHFDELLERIKVQLRNVSNTPNKLIFGTITMNIDARRVTKNGIEIPLTQKEFDLLEMLIKQKENVCKRTDIIKKVWDIHFDYKSGVIDVYINALRKKLNLAEGNAQIKTIRGVGYIAQERKK